MKVPGRCGKRRKKTICVLLAFIAVFAVVATGAVWASSGHGEATEATAAGEGAHGGGEGGHAGEEGGHGGHGGIHWQDTDWYRVLNFAILAIGLYLLLKKPLSQALNSRIKGIQTELEDLESRKSAVEKQLAEYNKKLAELDKEAEKIVADYIHQGEEAKKRILQEAQAAAERLNEQAQKNIAYEFNQAKLQLQAEIFEKALAKAEALIKNKISDADQDRLVDEYLDKVVA
jgi:F-type H+-transporting ATPase subunit b